MANHMHDFAAGSWPFAAAPNSVALVSRDAMEAGMPVLIVFHEHDGAWTFLNRPLNEECGDELKFACLGCAFELHPDVRDIADLPAGWLAWREDASCAWTRQEFEDDSDE